MTAPMICPRIAPQLVAACVLLAALGGAGAAPPPLAPLFPELGRYRFPADTRNPQAQRYVDQGMLLAYGFNPAEAARSFDAATRLDPRNAGGRWLG
jgi:hypothetical protein